MASAVLAHPRAGGENSYADKTDVTGSGSSPRGRGKPRAALTAASHDGLIPARAGKTKYYSANLPVRPAHPRAGGENRQNQ